MATKAPVVVAKTWTLIYNGIANGGTCGSLGVSSGGQIQVYFGTAAAPSEAENGVNVFDGTPFYLGPTDVMWGRSLAGASTVRIDTNLIMPIGTPLDTALVTQGFIEYNVKRGTQFEASSYNPALGVAGTQDSIFQTGAKPVIIKYRELGFDSKSLTLNLYKGPTFTGGTPVPIYNLNGINPVASTVTILGGATVTAVGTIEAAPRVFIGGTGSGQSRVASGPTQGLERILAPNSIYLSRQLNSSGEVMQVSSYTSWYEGALG